MPRAQNAHAYVNAGFLFRLNVNNGGKVLAKPTIVYGGINRYFVSITTTTVTTTMTTTTTTTTIIIIITRVKCESKSDTSNNRGD